MFYILNCLYLLSVITCFIYYKRFSNIAKIKPDRYNKLERQIEKKERETSKNRLNVFEEDNKSSGMFAFIVFSFIPIINLFLIYTYATYISFLRKD